MRVGSAASSLGTSWLNASTARNEPARILITPITIQPGPPTINAHHQRTSVLAVGAGKNRKKSTCSPIRATNEKITADAAPNIKILIPLGVSVLALVSLPENAVQFSTALAFREIIKTKGISCRIGHRGWVHN